MPIVTISDIGSATISHRRQLSKAACMQCEQIMHMVDDLAEADEDLEIPLMEIEPEIFDLVAEYLEFHAGNPTKEFATPITTSDIRELVGEWDANFIDFKNVEVDGIIPVDQTDRLRKIAQAAMYLGCTPLLRLAGLKVATVIRHRDVRQIRQTFGLDPEMTSEEIRRAKTENPWVFATQQT